MIDDFENLTITKSSEIDLRTKKTSQCDEERNESVITYEWYPRDVDLCLVN